MTEPAVDLAACDREPIHIPGSIQPHGVVLVANAGSGRLVQFAGDVEAIAGFPVAAGDRLEALLPVEIARRALATAPGPAGQYLGRLASGSGHRDLSAHRSGEHVLIEIEPAPADDAESTSLILADLEAATAAFQAADDIRELCEQAAREFRRLSGFDRVMVYKFLPDETGRVEAEAVADGVPSFLHHHFPASDIPRQARALYVRNLIRVIPDVAYVPRPLQPPQPFDLDLSDCGLRSVSPIHLQYLRNMGVGASASVSIIVNGALWGLIACHHMTAHGLSYQNRAACRALGAALAQQIHARDEAEAYRERLRLSSFAGNVVRVLSRDGPLDEAVSNHLRDIRQMLRSDGTAVVRGNEVASSGVTPSGEDIRELARWLAGEKRPVTATDRLSQLHAPALAYRSEASGLLAVFVSHDPLWAILWFRAEQVEVINWAGNPHKDGTADPQQMLTPRASFDAWSENVCGRSRGWSNAETEAAGRLRIAILEERQNWRIRELNAQLAATIRDKDLLLEQKQYLIGEVNHRVQNSLQLVSSFLSIQQRETNDPAFRSAIEEAVGRIQSVATLHRRLYRGDNIEVIDLGHYIEDLASESVVAMGRDWNDRLTLDLAPIMVPTDKAIAFGLIVSELLINARKYAYAGSAGPILVRLRHGHDQIQLVVADEGTGRTSPQRGFGSRMMDAMARQLNGTLVYEDNAPGLRAVLTAMIAGV